MFGLKIFAALTAMSMQPLAGVPMPDGITGPPVGDSAILADALSGRQLRLTMRGTTVTVLARAVPAEGGCAARITAHAEGSEHAFSRLFRWNELAWSGITPDGGARAAFFEQEGHLPADRLEFAAEDAAQFNQTLERVAERCRAPRGQSERVAIASQAALPGCYFARQPGLRLAEATAPYAARAMFTMLSRETPDAELQLFFERTTASDAGAGERWGAPWIDFTFADGRLGEVPVAKAEFALDGETLAAPHSIALYGDTRVRIRMAAPRSAQAGSAEPNFQQRLANSREVRMTLFDTAGQVRSVVHFEPGSAFAQAREAMMTTDGSCADAAPAPTIAAAWRPESAIQLSLAR